MTSDQITDEIDADEAKKTNTTQAAAVHLEIDGKMDVSCYPLARQQSKRDASEQIAGAVFNSREAGLRHVVLLQRQLLAQQGIRIQRQQSLIASLNNNLTRLQSPAALEPKAADKSGFYAWLISLIRAKNSSK